MSTVLACLLVFGSNGYAATAISDLEMQEIIRLKAELAAKTEECKQKTDRMDALLDEQFAINDENAEEINRLTNHIEELVAIKMPHTTPQGNYSMSEWKLNAELNQKYEQILTLLDIPKEKLMQSEPSDLVNEWMRDHKETKTNNNWLWCVMIAVGIALVLSFVFFVYHSYEKQRWEVLRLRSIVFANKDKAISIIAETPRERKDKMIAPVNDDFNRIKKQQILWNNEPFNKLICNSACVQSALIDDVVDNMVTEGRDTDKCRSNDEGMIRETQNV